MHEYTDQEEEHDVVVEAHQVRILYVLCLL